MNPQGLATAALVALAFAAVFMVFTIVLLKDKDSTAVFPGIVCALAIFVAVNLFTQALGV